MGANPQLFPITREILLQTNDACVAIKGQTYFKANCPFAGLVLLANTKLDVVGAFSEFDVIAVIRLNRASVFTAGERFFQNI